MFVELPQQLLIAVAGAFLLGWILSAINSRMGARFRASRRDARDDRIRELEAELRIARSDLDKRKLCADELEDKLKETTVDLERRDTVITEQQTKLDKAARDLKESVLKTRELRAELAERATANVQAEAKIREVETELSVVQASSDLLATGVLDYSVAQDAMHPDDDDESSNDAEHARTNTAV